MPAPICAVQAVDPPDRRSPAPAQIHTQEQAAEQLFVSRATIQNWESGATPIPVMLRSHCDQPRRRWKQRQPDHGPVALVYTDGPMAQPLWGPARIPMMTSEPWRSVEDALQRACELQGDPKFQHAFISDNDPPPTGIIFNSIELAKECERRRKERSKRHKA